MTNFNFSKFFFIPFRISTYKFRHPRKHPNFRIKCAGSSNYRGTSFFPSESLSSNVIVGDPYKPMNNETLKNLEFITQSLSSVDAYLLFCRGLRDRAKSPRPRRQVKKARKRSLSYSENVFGRQRRHRALQSATVELVVWIDSTDVENVRQIHLFMQNKPKVKWVKINLSSFLTSKYE